MENNAVCRGNHHWFYYGLELGKHNTLRGLDTPAHAVEGKPSTHPPHRTLGGQKKNLTKIGAGNLGRNQSKLRLPGPPTWILPTNVPVLHWGIKGPETRIVSTVNPNTMFNIQNLHQKQRAECRTKNYHKLWNNLYKKLIKSLLRMPRINNSANNRIARTTGIRQQRRYSFCYPHRTDRFPRVLLSITETCPPLYWSFFGIIR